MFDDIQGAFDQQEKERLERSKSITNLMVGSAAVKILAIQPTEAELVELIGEGGKKFDTRYQKSPGQYNDGKPQRSISFWITDINDKVSPVLISFDLVDSQRISKAGNPQWFNIMQGDKWNMLTTKWGTKFNVGFTEERNSEKNNAYVNNIVAPARVNEERYYKLLYSLLKWPDANTFFDQMKKEKLDFDSVFAGDFSGLRKLLQYINEPVITTVDGEQVEIPNVKTFMGIFTVKQRQDGRLVQSFANSSDLMFVNNADVLSARDLNGIKLAQENLKNKSGDDIMKDFYTLEPLCVYSEKITRKTVAPTDTVDEWFKS